MQGAFKKHAITNPPTRWNQGGPGSKFAGIRMNYEFGAAGVIARCIIISSVSVTIPSGARYLAAFAAFTEPSTRGGKGIMSLLAARANSQDESL